jgi:hypothetical protein
MEGYVDWLLQAVGAALDEPTETGRGWAGQRKATKGLERSRIDAQHVLNYLCNSWSTHDHTLITRASHRSDAMFLTADVPTCQPMGVAFAVLPSFCDAGFASW